MTKFKEATTFVLFCLAFAGLVFGGCFLFVAGIFALLAIGHYFGIIPTISFSIAFIYGVYYFFDLFRED